MFIILHFILQNALSKISYIIRHANDTMHIKRIVGYEVLDYY